ncbi:MAG TPA: response regulator [Elusimicrobiota bacterium]|nr:response regulator [Elusimicrobiota bacterium]
MAKILVVDDDKDIVDLICFLVQKDGHTTLKAGDGQACLDQVAREKPDMIVLDVMMPVMDGYTVVTQLASNDETRAIPILILTAKGQMREMFQMASNVADYLEKPFDPDKLRAQVTKILAGRPR